MTAPTITPLPDPPGRALDQGSFVAATKAWLGALVTFAAQMNAVIAFYFRASCLVSQLPVLTGGDAGARGFVTDANSATFGGAAVGGGVNGVPVFWNGSGWLIG